MIHFKHIKRSLTPFSVFRIGLRSYGNPFVKHFFYIGDAAQKKQKEMISNKTLEALCLQNKQTAKIIYEILCYSKSTEETRNEINKMKTQHNVNSQELSSSIGILFQELQKNNEIEKASNLYKISLEYSYNPSKSLINFLLTIYCEIGDTDELLKLLNEVKLRNISLKKQSLMMIIRYFCKVDKTNEMLEYLKIFCDKKLKPDPHLYNSLIYYYINKKQIDSAKLLIAHMNHHKVDPDKYTKPLLEFWLKE